jgi:hypothetical protein
MRIVLAVLPLLGQLLFSTPARAERAFARASANAAKSRGRDCGAGQVPKNGGCQNMPMGAPAPKCPSGVADGAGGCAPGQSAAPPPTQAAVGGNIRPPTSILPLGGMQVPWTVSIQPATNFVPIGNCLAVYIDLFDAAKKDIPRNPTGQRVSIADFDWTATGNAAVGKYNGPNSWSVCACPGAAVGSTVHVMATYPAAMLPEKAKVPGLAFQSYIELPVAKAPGTNVPAGCDNVLVTTTVATSVPGGQSPPPGPRGQGPFTNPPSGGTGTIPTTPAAPVGGTTPPPSGGPLGQVPYQATPLPITSPPLELAPAKVTPANPKRFSASQTGDGMVSLQWMPVPGVAYYQLWGPGLPSGGVTVSSGTSQVATGVPMGLQTWTVGSFYMPGAVSTPASAFTRAQLQVSPSVVTTPAPLTGVAYTPPPEPVSTSAPAPPPSPDPDPDPASARAASGFYRVVATGFRVLHQTKDDFLSRDGHGDEIYGGFMTFHYDRQTSKLLHNPDYSATQIIGEGGYDGYSFNADGTVPHVIPHGRLRGGTAAPDGGFAQNDVFPAVADPSQRYGVAPTRSTFPFLIFAGELTDGHDAVIIEPTLWEADGSHDGYVKWGNYEATTALQIWSDGGVQSAVSGTQLGLISPSGSLETSFGPHFDAGQAFGLALAPIIGPVMLLNSGSYDRPIGSFINGISGLRGVAAGPVLPRRAIVITREIVEAALTRLATYNPATVAPSVFPIYGAPPVVLPVPPPGTIAVQLFETPVDDLQGMYILYVKVERVACASANCIYAP